MYGLRVAAVGDGACSVFLSGGGTQPVGIIDCGSASSPTRAADGLRRILDLTRHPSLTIVVTHLHADHYNGLRHLSRLLGRQYVFGRVVLVQARLPRHPVVRDYVARLYALELVLGEVSGIPDLDLAGELRPACRYGLQRAPKSAGETIDLGGHRLDVLWPPEELTGDIADRIQRAIDNFDILAAQDPAIAGALRRVREADLPLIDDAPVGLDRVQRTFDASVNFDTALDDGRLDEEPDRSPTTHLPRARSDDRRPRYRLPSAQVREAARAFASVANDLSLVIATPSRDFVAWGDVPLPCARGIARRHGVPTVPGATQAVVLAPHHGSQGPTPSMGSSYACIAQHGAHLHGKWTAKHEHCAGSVCISTFASGDLAVGVPGLRWW